MGTQDSMQRLLETFTARFEDDMHPSMSRKSWNELPGVRLRAEELCVVCQESMPAGQWARAMHCGHKFHEECLEQWAKKSYQCPICRDDSCTTERAEQAHMQEIVRQHKSRPPPPGMLS